MNEEYQQQQYAPPLALPSEKADLLDKIQPNLIIDVIFHRLMGEVDINGRWVRDPMLSSRALTKKGAWDMATLMTPVSSQNVSISKLKDNEIRARSLSIARTAQEMCLRNWKEYGLKGSDHLRFVHELVFSNTFITLKQPEGAGLRNMIGDISQADFTQRETNQAQEMGGWFRK